MATVKVLDPISRIEGHLKIEVSIDTVRGLQQVVDARATGTLFRGFETILQGRSPLDAPDITQRICGVCPVSHGMAAVVTLDRAAGIAVPENGRILRNLVLAANFIQSHILHFYHLAALDYVDGPNQAPWQPSWKTDKRVSGAAANALVGNYVAALAMRRKAHEMGALFGGRLPHPPTYRAGGITATPRPERIDAYRAYLNELIPFIQNVYLNDVNTVASVYSDYFRIGKGHGNLLAYGVFDLDSTGEEKLLNRGRWVNGRRDVLRVDVGSITEQVRYSWYDDRTANLNPASGVTTPQYPKRGAYSWLKSPRYQSIPYEVGPLARMWVNGDYSNGISVLDRHAARALECLKVAEAAMGWLDEIVPDAPVIAPYEVPDSASAYGLTEAARGALGHWLNIRNGRIENYQVITPTCWNASPRDGNGRRGPLEQALVGTPIKNQAEPIEVLRVIHSFDPCLSCAVHVMRPKKEAQVFTVAMGSGPAACRP